MRKLSLLFAAGIVVSSPWWGATRASGQSTFEDSAAMLNPITQVQVTPVTMTAVRPLEIEGIHASPLPEPSSALAMGLLGSAFLIRRRRPRLD